MASRLRDGNSSNGHIECPSCGKELNHPDVPDVPELPCGHCICRSCAKELESKGIQKCAIQSCPYNKHAFEERIQEFNLPRRPVSEIDNTSMAQPPPYQGRN